MSSANERGNPARYVGVCKTAWGHVAYLHDGERLARLWYGDRSREEAERRARRIWPWAGERGALPGFEHEITDYFAGRSVSFRCAIRLDGVGSFHRKVYQAARRIPYGSIVTYGELAARAGSPRAARAVGQAMANNPIGIVIPCHRVVAANGGLGGFGPGLPVKLRLLRLEGVDTSRWSGIQL
jgi:methylated-DNA-[protein]-cysteine S-methyltransferase